MKKIFTSSLMILFLITSVFSQAGELDPSFAEAGILTWNVSGNHNNGNGIAVQPDGKIVIALSGSFPEDNDMDFAVVRLNEDGTPDSTFADNGVFHYDNPIGTDILYQLKLTDDGNIIIAGGLASDSQYDQDFALLKLKSDGSPDISFGNNGLVVQKIGIKEDYARCMAFNDEGQILVGGISYNPEQWEIRHVICRFEPDGMIDTTFGDNGMFVWNNGGTYNQTSGIEIAADGNIITAGKTSPNGNDRMVIYKVLEDGSSLDSTFATNGELLAPFGNEAYGMIIHSNGNILVTGGDFNITGNSLVVLAYNQDGTPNTNFGQDGVFLLDTELSSTGLNLIEQPDQKIIAVGESGNFLSTPPPGFFSTRMDENGILDTSWGGTGQVRTETGWNAWASDVAIQPDGKVVLTGVAAYDLNHLQVVRYGNYIDADMDGYGLGEDDCNDNVFAINPGVDETPYNGIDDDCDELTPDDDLDGDGFNIADDCDDTNAAINPNAVDIPDNDIDEDCDGNLAVGVNETALAQQFRVYPNPASSHLSIEFGVNAPVMERIEIKDYLGRNITSFQISSVDNKQEINLEAMPQGLLLIVIHTIEGIAVKRIVKN